MVQTLTRPIKIYVTDVNQKDWDAYAERLTVTISTAQNRVRGDTPVYLVHGWDPRSTLEATLPLRSTNIRDRDTMGWRYNIQHQHQRSRSTVNEHLRSRSKIEQIDIRQIKIRLTLIIRRKYVSI